MPRAVAVNVGANTNAPGVRGPIHPDGSCTFVPIPETEPTSAPVPTYADLGLADLVPANERETPVHLDPEFAELPRCERYTYGDPWGVKARPIADLSAGDSLFFYATLAPRGEGHPLWVPEQWGTFLVGEFRLARDPITPESEDALTAEERTLFANNAHLKRDPFDAAVLAAGDPGASGLLDCAVPLSGARGVEANWLVTDLSEDSGKGPWWRRPLRFEGAACERLREVVAAWPDDPRS